MVQVACAAPTNPEPFSLCGLGSSPPQKNSREKWQKCISVTGNLRGQAQVRPKDKLDEAYTNADDRMMLVQHCSGDRVMR